MGLRGALVLFLASALTLASCAGAPPKDLSPEAVASNDLTLVSSACIAAPGQGMDICRLMAGAPITGAWILVIPHGHTTLAGQLTVYYQDQQKTYAVPVGASTLTIPWADFLPDHKIWTQDLGGIAMALLTLQYKDGNGVIETAKFRGMAYLEILPPGYTRLPIGAQETAWKTTCQIEYTTAGRSAISCK